MFTFATVIYRKELALLRLQARSFAAHMPSTIVNEILVVVNDRDEASLTRAVEEIRDEYGPHVGKLRVLAAGPVLGTLSASRWRAARLLFPLLRGQRPQGGWRGNPGWLVQQALKLGVGRLAQAPHTVLLDAKNIWLAALEASDFIDEGGRALAEFIEGTGGKNQRAWLPPSLKAVGLPEDTFLARTTHFLTPFPVPTEALAHAVGAVEAAGATLAEVFLLARPAPTEFFILTAAEILRHGTLDRSFCEGLAVCTPIAAASSPEAIDQALAQAAGGARKCIAVHSAAWTRFSPAQHEAFAKLLQGAGLIVDTAAYHALRPG